MTQRYIVHEGEIEELGARPDDEDSSLESRGHYRDNYGWDWIVVEARHEMDALDQAQLFDAQAHPAQAEMNLFGAGYRAGEFSLWD